MAKTQQEAINIYYQLISQGVDPGVAYTKATEGMQTKEDLAKEQADQQQGAGLAGVGGTLAGVIGTKYLYDQLTKEVGEEAAKEIITQKVGEQAANSVASNVASAAGEQVAGNAASTFDISGGSMYPDGAMYPSAPGAETAGTESLGAMSTPLDSLGGYTPGQALGAAGALYGGYQSYKGLQNGGEGLRGGLTTTGAGIGTMILPGVGTALGAAGGNILGYGLQGDGIKNKIALAGMTGGLSLLPGVSGAMRGLIHKTTRQTAQEHTADLLKQNPDDANYQNYVAAMRQQYNAAPPDPSKPFAGKYGSWDEYKNAGLEAGDLTGVYGNLKTFGNEWTNKSFDDQKRITQGIIDAGLYNSNKGEVEITDQDKAREIMAQVMATNPKQAAGAQIAQALTRPSFGALPVSKLPAQISPLVQAVARSQTRSPGIDKQGNRIRY